jgi:UDP-N-acetyl-D-galactosamine dehydrogenase
MDYSINVHIHDPLASPNEVAHEYKMTLIDIPSHDYDAVVVAVAHDQYKNHDADFFKSIHKNEPIVFDIKGALELGGEEGMTYWRL